MRRSTLVTTLVAVAAVAFAVALGASKDDPPAAAEAARAEVRTVIVQRRALPGEVRAGGFLRARADVTVSAERAGRVVALPVEEGAAVAAGEIVARLDDTAARANAERARAVAREAALDPRLPAAERARAEEMQRLAEHELALLAPRSPVAGVVELHHVDPGEYVGPGTPLLDVIDPSELLLDVDVDGEVVGRLHPGDAVPVHVDALGPASAARTGTIHRIAGRADPRTRRFRIEVALDGASGGAGEAVPRPGMHAEARFALPGGAPAVYLPKEAVRRVRAQDGVYVVADDDVARWRPVAVAEVYHRPDLVRVTGDGLEPGAAVVVAGFPGLRDGMPVERAP